MIVLQVGLMFEPRAALRQKVITETYVEFLCDLSRTGLIVTVAFDISHIPFIIYDCFAGWPDV